MPAPALPPPGGPPHPLAARLAARAEQPGVVRHGMLASTLRRVQRMAQPTPLLDSVQRRHAVGRRSPGALPIVHAFPAPHDVGAGGDPAFPASTVRGEVRGPSVQRQPAAAPDMVHRQAADAAASVEPVAIPRPAVVRPDAVIRRAAHAAAAAPPAAAPTDTAAPPIAAERPVVVPRRAEASAVAATHAVAAPLEGRISGDVVQRQPSSPSGDAGSTIQRAVSPVSSGGASSSSAVGGSSSSGGGVAPGSAAAGAGGEVVQRAVGTGDTGSIAPSGSAGSGDAGIAGGDAGRAPMPSVTPSAGPGAPSMVQRLGLDAGDLPPLRAVRRRVADDTPAADVQRAPLDPSPTASPPSASASPAPVSPAASAVSAAGASVDAGASAAGSSVGPASSPASIQRSAADASADATPSSGDGAVPASSAATVQPNAPASDVAHAMTHAVQRAMDADAQPTGDVGARASADASGSVQRAPASPTATQANAAQAGDVAARATADAAGSVQRATSPAAASDATGGAKAAMPVVSPSPARARAEGAVGPVVVPGAPRGGIVHRATEVAASGGSAAVSVASHGAGGAAVQRASADVSHLRAGSPSGGSDAPHLHAVSRSITEDASHLPSGAEGAASHLPASPAVPVVEPQAGPGAGEAALRLASPSIATPSDAAVQRSPMADGDGSASTSHAGGVERDVVRRRARTVVAPRAAAGFATAGSLALAPPVTASGATHPGASAFAGAAPRPAPAIVHLAPAAAPTGPDGTVMRSAAAGAVRRGGRIQRSPSAMASAFEGEGAPPPSAEMPEARAEDGSRGPDVNAVAEQVYELLKARVENERRQRGW